MSHETPEAFGYQLPARRVMEDDRGFRQTNHDDIVQRGANPPGCQTCHQRPTLSYMVTEIPQRAIEDVGGVPLLFEIPLQILSGYAFSR